MADCLPSTEFHLSIPHWERESHLPVVQETTGKGSSRAAQTHSGPTLDCAFGRYLALLTAQALSNTAPTWQDGQHHHLCPLQTFSPLGVPSRRSVAPGIPLGCSVGWSSTVHLDALFSLHKSGGNLIDARLTSQKGQRFLTLPLP